MTMAMKTNRAREQLGKEKRRTRRELVLLMA